MDNGTTGSRSAAEAAPVPVMAGGAVEAAPVHFPNSFARMKIPTAPRRPPPKSRKSRE